MNRVGIVGYANTPFTKEEQKIESILHNSANQLFKNNLEIERGYGRREIVQVA